MPTLPRKQAAAVLGISVSTLLRRSASGLGIIKRGGRGKHNQTLYDTSAIAAQLRPRTKRDSNRAEQLHRGALSFTLQAAIDRELSAITVASLEALASSCSDSSQFLESLVRYLRARIATTLEDHFRPNKSHV